jgi:hypothetical protein
MAQSAVTVDYGKVYQGTAANAGGTFAANYAIPANQVAHLRARCIVSHATAGALDNCAALVASYVAENKGGAAASAPTALVGSNNPSNSNTTTFEASDAQASEYGGSGLVTLTWSVSGTDAVCTYTNVGNTVTVNVTIVIEAILVGST